MKKVLAILVILLTAFTMVSCKKSKDQVTNAVNAPIYTVTFESNGGTTVSAITVESGNTITEPTAPTKEGYALEGWYKETGLTNKWNFGTDKVTENITLYARWVAATIQNVDILVESGPTMTKSFYIQKYEVTQGQYEELMGYNPSLCRGVSGQTLINNPVEMITWYDAVMYANKLSEKEGLLPYYNITGILKEENRITSATVTENSSANGYRLPTEQQWEYAARGGNKSNNYTYSGSNNYDDVAWVDENNETNEETSGTKAVGGKQANELGIHDMSGNVWEWTNSPYDLTYTNRVVRGGSLVRLASFATVTYRDFYDPDDDYADMGFRLVRAS